MSPERLEEITGGYPELRIGLIGDLCLDRYFEIDPGLQEISIETNLPVHNVTRVRCQPGAAGTILSNLVALGVGKVFPAAIIGRDGEGYELRRALQRLPGVDLKWLVETEKRPTFTYSKPLLMHKDRPPEELSRLDIKNWTPTPPELQERIVEGVRALAGEVDALVVLDQVDVAETGVVTRRVLERMGEVAAKRPDLLIVADSRRSLRGWPPVALKMNAAELALYFNDRDELSVGKVQERALKLAEETGKAVFITLAEKGIIGAMRGEVIHAAALPVRGEIDIVGAGDSVTANLTAALSAGASLGESLEVAQMAASIVVHQLGTTGTASREQLREVCGESGRNDEAVGFRRIPR